MTVARQTAPSATTADHTIRTRTPAVRFVVASIFGTVAAVAAGVAVDLPLPAIIGASAALVVALVASTVGLVRHHPHARLGWANIVTLVRLSIVAVLLGMLLAGGGQSTVIIVMSVVALSLDGVDGYLARRQRLASPFGARFDMEVDSAFALVLSLLAALGPAGPAAVVLGVPRYVFWLASKPLPWLNGELPARPSRRVVCVVQLIALIVLQIPWLPPVIAAAIVGVTAAIVGWSFALDVVWLRRHREHSIA
jgi:phosphatidylglycerophosphate synthase